MTDQEAKERSLIVEEARSWLRTPFRMGQMVKGQGVDCGCILVSVYGTIGIIADPVGYFTVDWASHTHEERYVKLVEPFSRQVNTPLPGDVVLVRLRRGRPFCHGGIVINWPTVIHAYDRSGVEYVDATKVPMRGSEQRFYSPWPRNNVTL